MSKVGTLKVGDKVMWSGSWGKDSDKEATVTDIEVVKSGEKYGELIDEVPWSIVGENTVVTLDNGHWAYGYQIKPVKEI